MKKVKILVLLLATLLYGCGTKDASSSYHVAIDNPYSNVNWKKATQIRSTTHIHIMDQAGLERAAQFGYRHLPISNYYPSAPYYPINSIRQGQFRVKQEWGVMKIVEGESHYVEGPIYWNEMIMNPETGWFDSLPKEQQDALPFEEGDFIFTDIPASLIFSPNAEHHAFADTHGNVHVNGLGSFYSSGTFDARNRFRTFWGGGDYSYGTGLPWKDAFQNIIDQLQYEDGGGVTINHPGWSGKEALPQSLIEEMLDFDERVLGIEVLEAGLWSTEIWDEILKTGRRCLGFSVPDWQVQTNEPDAGGFNLLLVDEYTDHNCLKSYREGAFFGSQFGSEELIFTNISLEKNHLLVQINREANISIISDQGVSKVDGTDRVKFKIPRGSDNLPTIKYVRVEAETDSERIFSQPIRFIQPSN
ncbi:MAG: hypothetical protein GXZ19_08755 [Bacteroidales bacterium]|nr:hypothetical protein [Bacteroidales bacterium]